MATILNYSVLYVDYDDIMPTHKDIPINLITSDMLIDRKSFFKAGVVIFRDYNQLNKIEYKVLKSRF